MPSLTVGNRKRSSTSSSPSKRSKKIDNNESTLYDDISELPDNIIAALKNNGIGKLDDFKSLSIDILYDKISKPILASIKNEIISGLSAEIIKAWLRFLKDKADGQIDNKFNNWQSYLDAKIAEKLASPPLNNNCSGNNNSSLTGKADKTATNSPSLDKNENNDDSDLIKSLFKQFVGRKQLIRQRQALKKRGLPKSKQISRDDLRIAKSSLVKLPTNKSLSNKVKAEDLKNSKQNLKKGSQSLNK